MFEYRRNISSQVSFVSFSYYLLNTELHSSLIQYNGLKSSFLKISVIPRLISILLHIKVVY